MRQWYYTHGGQRYGPIAESDLVPMFESGQLTPDTMVWNEELENWVLAHDANGLICATNGLIPVSLEPLTPSSPRTAEMAGPTSWSNPQASGEQEALTDHGAAVSSLHKPSESTPSKRVSHYLLTGMVVGLVIFFGNFHVITGGRVGPQITPRESFGFSEIFINVDRITGMPWISAKSQNPLGCRILAREGIIESDREFRERTNREVQREIDKAMENAQEEYEKILRDLNQ